MTPRQNRKARSSSDRTFGLSTGLVSTDRRCLGCSSPTPSKPCVASGDSRHRPDCQLRWLLPQLQSVLVLLPWVEAGLLRLSEPSASLPGVRWRALLERLLGPPGNLEPPFCRADSSQPAPSDRHPWKRSPPSSWRWCRVCRRDDWRLEPDYWCAAVLDFVSTLGSV